MTKKEELKKTLDELREAEVEALAKVEKLERQLIKANDKWGEAYSKWFKAYRESSKAWDWEEK